jgi:hypothetical protein
LIVYNEILFNPLPKPTAEEGTNTDNYASYYEEEKEEECRV